MVARSYASTIKTRALMRSELDSLLERTDYFEEQLDTLRRYRNEEFLRIGLNDPRAGAPLRHPRKQAKQSEIALLPGELSFSTA